VDPPAFDVEERSRLIDSSTTQKDSQLLDVVLRKVNVIDVSVIDHRACRTKRSTISLAFSIAESLPCRSGNISTR
jgi:hypothetical protein